MKKKVYAGFVLDDVSPEEAVNAALTGADGIVMTDISEDDEEHDAFMGGIRELARRVEAPLISGGRVKRLEDVKKYLYVEAGPAEGKERGGRWWSVPPPPPPRARPGAAGRARAAGRPGATNPCVEG